jgi:hypothetical protein
MLTAEGKTEMGGRMQEVKMNGQPLSAREARLIRFPGPAGAGNKDRSNGREVATSKRDRPKPAWHVLYAVFAVTVLLFVVADVESPAGGWRILTECLGTALVIGAMALWVRANRAALAHDDAPDGGETLRRYVAYSPRSSSLRGLDFSGIERSQRSLAQMRTAEEKDAKCSAK